MASQIIDTVERDGKTIWVYENGMEKDASNGHIVKPPPHTLIKDTQDSTALHRARHEKKRAVIQQAANDAVMNGKFQAYGDMAFVAEIAHNAQVKARNPKDPKQIDAARFLLQETGLSVAQEQPVDDHPAGIPRVILLLARLYERSSGTERDISVRNNFRVDEQGNGSPTAWPELPAGQGDGDE